jgi:FkbM family methyltransferase
VSQVGQDYWVYGEVFNERENGYFLDIGAHDGVYLSNTFLLEARYHWKGICIEGNPETYSDLKKNRTCKCINVCVDSKESSVTFALRGVMGGIVSEDCDNSDATRFKTVEIKAMSLSEILLEHDAPQVIDYLSIDIEGAEDRALLDFPFSHFTFNCITIERPSQELRNKLIENKYILIKEIPRLDCFYVHESFLGQYHKNKFSFGAKKYLTKRWS